MITFQLILWLLRKCAMVDKKQEFWLVSLFEDIDARQPDYVYVTRNYRYVVYNSHTKMDSCHVSIKVINIYHLTNQVMILK